MTKIWVFIKLTMESGRGKRRERHLCRLVSKYLHGACGPCLCGQSNKTHLVKSGGPSLKAFYQGFIKAVKQSPYHDQESISKQIEKLTIEDAEIILIEEEN